MASRGEPRTFCDDHNHTTQDMTRVSDEVDLRCFFLSRGIANGGNSLMSV